MKSMHVTRSAYGVGILLLAISALPVPAQDRAAVREINGILDRFETCFLDEDVAGIEAVLADQYILAIDDRQSNGDSRRSRVYHVYARVDGRWVIVFSSSRLAS